MKVKFNKKQMDFLSRFEDTINTAVKSNFVRAVPWVDVQAVVAIWNDATGDNMVAQRGCSVCTLNLFKQVGKFYLAQREEENKPKKKSASAEKPKNTNHDTEETEN